LPNAPVKLQSAKAKVLWAQEHLRRGAEVIKTYIRHECRALPQIDSDPRWTNVVAHLPEPPIDIAAYLGDAVHNLRCALDHIVYEVVSRNPDRPDGTPNRQTMFPICDSAEGFQDQVKRRNRLVGMPESAIALVREFQPYHRRDKAPDHTLSTLWILDQLENIDKHRRLCLTASYGFETEISVVGASGLGERVSSLARFGHGAILHRYPTPTTAEGEVHVQGKISAHIAFNELTLPSIRDADVGRIINTAVAHLLNKVIPAFEPFV
jgi:hypothetical protein